MKKSERRLLYITIGVGACALACVYVLEPLIRPLLFSSASNTRNKNFLAILDRKERIRERAKTVLASHYWRRTSQEQRMALESYIEEIARKSGISQIQSLLPLPSKTNADGSAVISYQISFDCSLDALTRLLYSAGTSDVPLQVRKLQVFGETGNHTMIKVQIEIASVWMPVTEN